MRLRHSDLHGLTGVYALDALAGPELDRFTRHLGGCPGCEHEVRGFRETATQLALAVAAALTDRTRSMARRCAIVIAQVSALPRVASKRDAVRQTSSSTSCATSSDWAGSRTTLRARPYTGRASCS